MRDDNEKRIIASSMLQRIESMPRVVAATAPVFSINRQGKPQFFASAVLIKVNNWHFALTAGHVLDEHSISDLYIGSGNKVVPLRGSHGITVPPGAGSRKKDKIDIGFVRLTEEAVRDVQEDEFLALDDTYNLDAATTIGHYVLTGYPRSKHKSAIKGSEAEATPYSFVVAPAPLADYHEAGLNPGISLLLRFEKGNLWRPSGRVVGPDLTGISGGGVWFVDNAFATTQLKPLLVAIAVEWWRKPPQRVLATKLHVAVSAIWFRFPELRPYLSEPPY